MRGLELISTGRALPDKCVKNDDLREYVDTSDQWIRSRTGICTRYYSETDNYSQTLAAARQAMERSNLRPEEIGLCIVATITPDYATPSMACLLQRDLGLAEDIPVFDLNAACSGFVYSLEVAHKMLSQDRPYALLLGTEQLSRILDFTDRSTCVLFGDGAGAAIVKLSDSHLFMGFLGAKGDRDALWCGGVGRPEATVHMNGSQVFRFATGAITDGLNKLSAESGIPLTDIDHILCHQANYRIISHVQRKLKLSMDRFYVNLDKYGNTSAASIPIALDEMAEKGMLKKGQHIALLGFGGGLTWGSALWEL